MLRVGCHLSSSKGYVKMGQEGVNLGALTCQFFSRNPRGGKAKKINENDLAKMRKFITENDFQPLLVHAPYTLNCCSADPSIREFAEMVFREDLEMLEFLPGSLYNFHPGSHVGQGVDIGIEQISGILNRVIHPTQKTIILLETMSGKGSEIGRSFEEIRRIIDATDYNEKLGVCLDTCHVFSAGYDIVNDLDGVLDEFDHIIGLTRLKAIHLNDSMTPYASNKDRHEKIGKGSIGFDGIVNIINHPILRSLPFYLETPNDLVGYAEEIALLKKHYCE